MTPSGPSADDRRRAPDPAFRTETASMGESQVDLDPALQLVAELEDDELIARTGRRNS